MLAFRALKIGLKHNYDNWRMWMNYMIVAMDVGEFAEAARAQARVVEERADKIGAAAVDEDVVDRLVDAVVHAPNAHEEKPDSADAEPQATAKTLSATEDTNSGAITSLSPNEGARLRPRILDLFERTLLQRVASERLYRAYARLIASDGRWTDAVKYHLDAYRLSLAATLEKGESDKAKFLEALAQVEGIIDVLRNFGSRADEEETVMHENEVQDDAPVVRTGKWQMQARSIVRSFAARTREAFEDSPEWGRIEQLQEELRK